MFCLKFIFSMVFILLSVAFFTLLEQKILGYSHARVGPNLNVLQPLMDALKLFSKSDFMLLSISYFFYGLSPLLGIFLSILMWNFFPFYGSLIVSGYSLLIIILVSGFGVYFLLYSGWSTKTKYSAMGSYRSSAQSISYEVVMLVGFLVIVYMWVSMSFTNVFNSKGFFLLMSVILFLCWFLSCLAECNRSPFDFSEGESELVSGFNTEYAGGLFSLLFIGEYSSIIFFSCISAYIFSSSSIFLLLSILSFSFLWVRCSYPRLRYDLLMMMGWKGLMCILLGVFFVLTSF